MGLKPSLFNDLSQPLVEKDSWKITLIYINLKVIIHIFRVCINSII